MQARLSVVLLLASCALRPPTVVIVQTPAESCPLAAPVASPVASGPAPSVAPVKEITTPSPLQADVYWLEPGTATLPNFKELKRASSFQTTTINVPARESIQGFPNVSREEWFGINYHGDFFVEEPGDYLFRLTADDGAALFIDGQEIITNDGIHPPTTADGEVYLEEGKHHIQVPYFQGPKFHVALILEVTVSDQEFVVFDTTGALREPLPEFGLGRLRPE